MITDDLNDPVNLQAIRYAVEATRLFRMERFRRKFPHYFTHVRFETRPATSRDYYVPPTLDPQWCRVATVLAFDAEGCRRFSCLFFRDRDWNVCGEKDLPRWIGVGDGFELACQGGCRDHAVNTDWTTDGRCVVANPLKKAFAAAPEKVLGRQLRSVYHHGLDVQDGTLRLNETYCRAYGLVFRSGDCVSPEAQSWAEWLFGITPVRALKTAGTAPVARRPPPLPPFATVTRRKRRKRAVAPPLSDEIRRELEERRPLLRSMAAEVAKEIGTGATEHAVERFLVQKAPRWIAGAVDAPAGRLAVKYAMTFRRQVAFGVKGLGRALGTATTVYAAYDALASALDAMDLRGFAEVLTADRLRDIDATLDFDYFFDGKVRPEWSPEDAADVLGEEEDEAETFAFLKDRVEEYLAAWLAEKTPPPPAKKTFAIRWRTDPSRWTDRAFLCFAVVLLGLAVLLVERIDVWSNALFFLKVFFGF